MAENTFTGTNTKFRNTGLHFLLGEIMKLRKQVTVRPEVKVQSGWDNALNGYMQKELEKIADTVENITYKPEEVDLNVLEDRASDTTSSLLEKYGTTSLSADNVVMPAAREREIVWDLSGNDLDIPQLNPQNCPNDVIRAFITGLDELFVEATRLDSRHQSQTITKYESVMIHALLDKLYTLTMRKGGEANRSDIPVGTLPSQEAQTFMNAK